MIRVFAEVRIEKYDLPHRQIWRATDSLASGSTILINASHHLPSTNGDFRWFRSDLNYQVVCESHCYQAWADYFLAAGGDQGGRK